MRKNFGAKMLMYPMPIFVVASYDEHGNPNALTAGATISDFTHLSLWISSNHKSAKNILTSGAFTVSNVTADYITQCDYIGIVSGNNVPNKIEKAGFSTSKSEFVNAPIINELPLTFECKLESYDEKTGLVIGEIINTSVDESILDDNGKINQKKLKPISLDSMYNSYWTMGEKIADAYKEGAKIK